MSESESVLLSATRSERIKLLLTGGADDHTVSPGLLSVFNSYLARSTPLYSSLCIWVGFLQIHIKTKLLCKWLAHRPGLCAIFSYAPKKKNFSAEQRSTKGVSYTQNILFDCCTREVWPPQALGYTAFKMDGYRIFEGDTYIDIWEFQKSDNDILADIHFLYTTHNLDKQTLWSRNVLSRTFNVSLPFLYFSFSFIGWYTLIMTCLQWANIQIFNMDSHNFTNTS